MKMIIGLGNPGKKYDKTRHNAGFMVLNRLHKDLASQKYDFSDFKFINKHNAEIAEGRVGVEKVLLVKPQIFMNESGKSVQSIVNFYKIIPERDLVVIYDDIDLLTGEVRTTGTSAGGHKGMQSIIDSLGTEEIPRIRVGILGKPKEKISNTAKYVLSKFTKKELKEIDLAFLGISSVINEFIMK